MTNIYINREIDYRLYKHLLDGKSCYIYGPSQTGKTFLIEETKRQLQNTNIQSAMICFKSFILNDEKRKKDERECYRCLVDDIAKQIKDKNGELVSESRRYKNYRNKFRNKLRYLLTGQWIKKFLENILLKETQGNVVIFLDEIDILFDDNHFNHCFPENLLKAINSCLTKRRLAGRITFAIFSREKSENLRNRHKNQLKYLFSKGEEVDVDDFNKSNLEKSEFKKLISNQLEIEDLSDRFEDWEKIVHYIFYWTKGQPFLTYEILICLLDCPTFPISRGIEEDIINEIVDLESDHFVELDSVKAHLDDISNSFPKDANLLFFYEEILQNGEVNYKQAPETAKLLSLGLVRREGDKLKIHNPIYENQFDQDWINITRVDIEIYNRDKATKANKTIEKITPIFLILADIFSILGTVYFFNTFFPWRFLGLIFLLIALTISVLLLIGYFKTDWARKIIEFIESRFPIISKTIRRNITITNSIIFIFIILLVILGHFWITCHFLDREGNRILSKWDDANRIQHIEILEDALKNGHDLQNIYWLNDFPLLRRAIPTSPLLALQKINNEINEKNQFKYSDNENITAISSLPNSKKIVTGGADGTLKIWDSSTESDDNTKFTQQTEQKPISSLSVSSDGEIIATGGKNAAVALWDGSEDGDFKLLQTLPCKDKNHDRSDLTVTNVIFSSKIDDESYGSKKHHYLAAGTREGDLCIWEGYDQKFELVGQTKLEDSDNNKPKDIKKLRFSNDRKIIAIATDDGLIEFREVPKLNFIKSIKPYNKIEDNSDYLLDFNFNKDGDQIITAGKDPTVKVWEWQTYREGQNNKPLQEWEVYQNPDKEPFISVRFGFAPESSNNRQMSVVKTQGKLKFLELKTGELCEEAFKGDENCPQPKELEANDNKTKNVTYGSIQLASGKQEFITTLEEVGENTPVTTWQVNPKSPFQKNTLNLPPQDSIKGIEIRRNGKENSYYILSITKNSRVEIWDQYINNETHFSLCDKTPENPYVSVKFLPDESQWATLSQKGLIQFWNYNPGDCGDDPTPIKIPTEEKYTNQLALSSKNNLMAVAFENANKVLLWNRTEEKGSITMSDAARIKFMRFSKDGKNLLLAGDSYASVWDVSDVNNLQNIRPGDGKYFSLGSEENELNITGNISNISFTPNKNVALTSTREHKIFKWNTSGKELTHFDFNEKLEQLELDNKGFIKLEGIDNFSFSQDRPLLAVVFHQDELPVIQIWDWDKEKPLAQFQSSLKTVNTIKFNPEGDLIVVGGERKENGKPGEVFELHDLDQLLKDSCIWLTDYHNIHPSEAKSICQFLTKTIKN